MSYYAEIAEEVAFDTILAKLASPAHNGHNHFDPDTAADALMTAFHECPAIEKAMNDWASKEIEDAVVDHECKLVDDALGRG